MYFYVSLCRTLCHFVIVGYLFLLAPLSFAVSIDVKDNKVEITGLEKIGDFYPWIAEFYPDHSQDVLKQITASTDFAEKIDTLLKPHQKMDIMINSYLDDKMKEGLLLRGIGLTLGVLGAVSGGLGGALDGLTGSVSGLDDTLDSLFQVTINEQIFTIHVHRDDNTVPQLPEKQKHNVAVRDAVYENIISFFIEDLLTCLQKVHDQQNL